MKPQMKKTFLAKCPSDAMRGFAIWYAINGSGDITSEALIQALGKYAVQKDLCQGVVVAWTPKIREWTAAYHAANRG